MNKSKRVVDRTFIKEKNVQLSFRYNKFKGWGEGIYIILWSNEPNLEEEGGSEGDFELVKKRERTPHIHTLLSHIERQLLMFCIIRDVQFQFFLLFLPIGKGDYIFQISFNILNPLKYPLKYSSNMWCMWHSLCHSIVFLVVKCAWYFISCIEFFD